MENQKIKQDAGKLPISLVPMQIVRDIALVRDYGNRKYGDPKSWEQVAIERYLNAFGRHALYMLEDPMSVDDESGIEHYKHAACNLAFICHMLSKKNMTLIELQRAAGISSEELLHGIIANQNPTPTMTDPRANAAVYTKQEGKI